MSIEEKTYISLKVRVQNIYYQSSDDKLKVSRATSDKKISLSEAEDILIDRQLEYKDVLKVRIEYIDVEMPISVLDEYVVQ